VRIQIAEATGSPFGTRASFVHIKPHGNVVDVRNQEGGGQGATGLANRRVWSVGAVFIVACAATNQWVIFLPLTRDGTLARSSDARCSGRGASGSDGRQSALVSMTRAIRTTDGG
jgi:hypothetical protein